MCSINPCFVHTTDLIEKLVRVVPTHLHIDGHHRTKLLSKNTNLDHPARAEPELRLRLQELRLGEGRVQAKTLKVSRTAGMGRLSRGRRSRAAEKGRRSRFSGACHDARGRRGTRLGETVGHPSARNSSGPQPRPVGPASALARDFPSLRTPSDGDSVTRTHSLGAGDPSRSGGASGSSRWRVPGHRPINMLRFQ